MPAGFKSQTWTVWIIYRSRIQIPRPHRKTGCPAKWAEPAERLLDGWTGVLSLCPAVLHVLCCGFTFQLWQRRIAALLTAKSLTGFSCVWIHAESETVFEHVKFCAFMFVGDSMLVSKCINEWMGRAELLKKKYQSTEKVKMSMIRPLSLQGGSLSYELSTC